MVSQKVISVNGKKIAKYGGCKNPPFKFPVVSEVNSLGDSKPFYRKHQIMGIFNSSNSQASANNKEVVKDFNYYNSLGFTIIALNIGANERFYEGKQTSSPITSNKGRVSCSANGSVFFTGTIAGFYQWSKTRNQFIAPPAVRSENGSDVTDPDAKPTGFVGMYMRAAYNAAKDAVDLFTEDGELDKAIQAEESMKNAQNLDFLVNQEIAFDLPTNHQVVITQSQALRNKRQRASKEGRSAGSLQATLVLAVKIAFPKAGILQPIIKVHEILSWEGEYMPLPIAGRIELTDDQAETLMLEAETMWNEEAATASLDKSMGQAAINLLVGDNAGTTRTKRTNEYRKRNAQKKAQQAAFQALQESNVDTSIPPQDDIEEISEEDLDSLGSMGI